MRHFLWNKQFLTLKHTANYYFLLLQSRGIVALWRDFLNLCFLTDQLNSEKHVTILFSFLSLTFHKKKIYFSVEKGCYSCDISIFLRDKKEIYTVATSTLEHCTKYKYASHK